MVKTEIIITDYKDVNSTLTNFVTSAGRMSAFKNEGDTLIQDLKDHTNRLISVETKETISKTDGKIYVNIRKFYGAIAKQETKPEGTEVISPQKFTRPENYEGMKAVADGSIEMKTTRKSVKGSAYEKDPVGLAVEVFCAIKEGNSGDPMTTAIKLVKQAQEAFS